MKLPKIEYAKPLYNYKILCLFQDGKLVVYNAYKYFKNIKPLEKLNNINYFLTMAVQPHRVFWSDKEDIPADILYYGEEIHYMNDIKISEFYGIDIFAIPNTLTIKANYNDWQAIFSIKDKTIISGDFPPEGTEDVIEWLSLYEDELVNMLNSNDIHNIKPLL